MRGFVILSFTLCAWSPARAWYNPLDPTRTDGQSANLMISTHYHPYSHPDCNEYPFNYYGACGVHPAYDIGSTKGGWWLNGQPVHAADGGVVLAIDPDGYCGKDVWIDHKNGYVTRYCHLSSFANISVGQNIGPRDVIGYVGNTGTVTPHLHFEMHYGTNLAAPFQYVDSGYSTGWSTSIAGCNGIDYKGQCNGQTLVWCENQSLKTADCANLGKQCVWQDDNIGYNCVVAPPPPPAPPPAPPPSSPPATPISPCEQAGVDARGRCDGARATWCENGAVQNQDCASTGLTCGEQNAVGYRCIAASGEFTGSSVTMGPPAADDTEAPLAFGAIGGCAVGRTGSPSVMGVIVLIAFGVARPRRRAR